MKWTSVAIVTGFTGALAFVSCKNAGYDTFLGSQKSQDDNQPGLILKTNVEVVDGDKVVSEAVVGQTVTIRPSRDSAYGPIKVDCLNTGLIKINYDAGDSYKQDITRAKGCEPDSITHAFGKVGEYVITMVVLTPDGKTSSVQTKIKVRAAPIAPPVTPPVGPVPSPFRQQVNPMPTPMPMPNQRNYYYPCDPCQQYPQPPVYYYPDPCTCN